MKKLGLLVGLCLAVFVTACGDDDDGAGTVADAAQVDAPIPDAGPVDGPSFVDGAVGIACGASSCNLEQKCCVNVPLNDGGLDGDAGVSAECIATAATCEGNGTLVCDGPEDCSGSGQVCCGQLGGGGSASTSCIASAECTVTSLEDIKVRMCHNDGDCPAARKCCPIDQPGAPEGFCLPFGTTCPML